MIFDNLRFPSTRTTAIRGDAAAGPAPSADSGTPGGRAGGLRAWARGLVLAAVALAFFPMFPAESHAATFYVNNACSTNGNGTGSGCAGSSGGAGAWNSLGAAASCNGMAASDTLEIRAGTGVYRVSSSYYGWDLGAGCSGATGAPKIIQNYANESVRVIGSTNIKGTSSNWTSIGNGVYLCTNQTCNALNGLFAFAAWYQVGSGPEQSLNLIESNRTCTSSLPEGYMLNTGSSTTFTAVCVHLAGGVAPYDSSVQYLDIPTSNVGIGMVNGAIKHLNLRRNPLGGSFTVERFSWQIIQHAMTKAQDITIDGLNIGWATDRCINFEPDGSGTVGVTLKNSHIYYCGQEGIHLTRDKSTAGVQILNNEFDHIQYSPQWERCSTSSCYTRQSDEVAGIRFAADQISGQINNISGNKFHDFGCAGSSSSTNPGRGFLLNFEGSGYNTYVDNNYFYNFRCGRTGVTALKGIGVAVGTTGVTGAWRNNRFYNGDTCMDFEIDSGTVSMNLLIANNTCVDMYDNGLSVTDQKSFTTTGTVTVVNNVFRNSFTPQSGGLILAAPNQSGAFNSLSNNVFYCDSSCSNLNVNWKGTSYSSSNLKSVGTNNTWGDPNLATTGSPPSLMIRSAAGVAYHTGLTLSPSFSDAIGDLRTSTAWDVGAVQFTNSSALAPPTNVRILSVQ